VCCGVLQCVLACGQEFITCVAVSLLKCVMQCTAVCCSVFYRAGKSMWLLEMYKYVSVHVCLGARVWMRVRVCACSCVSLHVSVYGHA